MPAVSRIIRMIVLLVSGAVLLSALGVGGVAVAVPAIQPGQQPAWLLFGFEVVTLVAAALGIGFGMGKFGDGPGLALACVSGTILMASALGWLGANRQLAGYSLTPVVALRSVAALVIGALAGFCVLSRDPRSWRLAGWGAATGLPCMLAAGAVLRPGARRVIENAIGRAGTAGTIAALILVIALGGLLCASVHLLIRAFELGRVDSGAGGPGPS